MSQILQADQLNILKKSSILVTGGAGFIGSNIVDSLLENGVGYVRILDNLSTGDKHNIYNALNMYNNVEFMQGDISDLSVCKKAVYGMDLICHQAAAISVPRSIEDPLTYHNSNVTGFFNLLLAAKESVIRRIVFASSSSVYGDDETLPKVENITGDMLSPYAVSKMMDELYGKIFTRCYNMECIGLRYFNVFGPRQNPVAQYAAVIPKFIDSIMKDESPLINGDGAYSRDFTYVENVIYANILALTTPDIRCFGEIFNIGVGEQISIQELFERIKFELKSNIDPIYGEIRKGDIPHSNADISKAIDMLKYKPIINFSQGIKKLILTHRV
jgi:UDP-N-acetylglucosamine/UDP-N-acetylgalactosamine 4-epimerase